MIPVNIAPVEDNTYSVHPHDELKPAVESGWSGSMVKQALVTPRSKHVAMYEARLISCLVVHFRQKTNVVVSFKDLQSLTTPYTVETFISTSYFRCGGVCSTRS